MALIRVLDLSNKKTKEAIRPT